MILLDTDILIDFVRGHAACRAWLLSQGAEPIAIPIFTTMELYAGCRNKREQEVLRKQLAPYLMLWPDESSAVAMVSVFADVHLTHATGILDSLIAATAISHKLPLHTYNVKHFSAIEGLQLVQPYVR